MPLGIYVADQVIIYPAENAEVFEDFGTDNMTYGNAGDDIHQHVGRWGKWYSSPIYTGSSLVLETPDEDPPNSTVEGALKSWGLRPPYDVRVTLGGIVFPFPANYAYMYFWMRRDVDWQYVRVRLGGNYPNNIYITGGVSGASSSYDANNGTLAEIPAGEVKLRIVANDIDVHSPGAVASRTYFWNNNTSSWQQLHYRGYGAPNDSAVPGVYVSSDGANPEMTVAIEHVAVEEGTDYVPQTFRLGNNTYRKVRGRFQHPTEITGSEDNGLLMSTYPANTGSNPFHMFISDPPPIHADEAWTVEAKYEIENIITDTRYDTYFEIGHFPHGYRGYDVNGSAAVYQDMVNYCYGSGYTSAVRMQLDGTYSRLYHKVWNAAGAIVSTNYVSYADELGGTFRCINNGAGTFLLYFGNTLIYTWTPTNWATAGYANDLMYIGLGYTDGYADCKCRWLYCTIT